MPNCTAAEKDQTGGWEQGKEGEAGSAAVRCRVMGWRVLSDSCILGWRARLSQRHHCQGPREHTALCWGGGSDQRRKPTHHEPCGPCRREGRGASTPALGTEQRAQTVAQDAAEEGRFSRLSTVENLSVFPG